MALRNQGVDFSASEYIELMIPELIIPAVGKTEPPDTSNAARFHLQYCAALAASGVDFIGPGHSVNFESYISRPEIAALMNKTRLVPLVPTRDAPGPPYNQSMVRVGRADGQILKGLCNAQRGSADNPLSDEQVIEKFRLLTQPIFESHKIESCIVQTLELENQKSCSVIFELLDHALSVEGY